jgi:hypothetical protein
VHTEPAGQSAESPQPPDSLEAQPEAHPKSSIVVRRSLVSTREELAAGSSL